MEQQAEQPLPAAGTQKADSVVVNMELQLVISANANDGGDYRVLDVKARPIGGGGQKDHHVVVDVDRLTVVNAASRDDDPPPRMEVKPEGGGGGDSDNNQGGTGIWCVLCKKTAKWVAIGRCGHRVVCSTCMVHARFFQKNKKCCVCRTPCPKVLVTKAEDDRAATALSNLPRFAFRDGRVGNYWYHGYTRAFFDEEKQYQAARVTCEGIIQPWYHPPIIGVPFFMFFLAVGAALGYAFSDGLKGWPQVRTYIISISVALLFASTFWFLATCAPVDAEVLEIRRINKKLEAARRIRLGSG